MYIIMTSIGYFDESQESLVNLARRNATRYTKEDMDIEFDAICLDIADRNNCQIEAVMIEVSF